MVKLLVRFSSSADNWLRKEADKLGISVAELLRRIVDKARSE